MAFDSVRHGLRRRGAGRLHVDPDQPRLHRHPIRPSDLGAGLTGKFLKGFSGDDRRLPCRADASCSMRMRCSTCCSAAIGLPAILALPDPGAGRARRPGAPGAEVPLLAHQGQARGDGFQLRAGLDLRRPEAALEDRAHRRHQGRAAGQEDPVDAVGRQVGVGQRLVDGGLDRGQLRRDPALEGRRARTPPFDARSSRPRTRTAPPRLAESASFSRETER